MLCCPVPGDDFIGTMYKNYEGSVTGLFFNALGAHAMVQS